jgi:hypothetical protein
MSQASFHDDAESVVKAIQDSVKTEVIEIGGREFTSRPVYLPPTKQGSGAIKIHTLDGLAAYLNDNADSHNGGEKSLLIVVTTHKSVSVINQIAEAEDARHEWLEAVYEAEGFPFGRFIDHEDFMVKAQALFVETESLRQLLKYVGNLTTARIQTSTDDGKTQTVVVEQGVRKSEVDLPNPVHLRPRRTFPEISQPESPFVLRVRQTREGQMPEIALFEADGGLWKVEAIEAIKAELGELIASDIPIIG